MRRALNTSNSVKAAGQIRHNLHTAGGRRERQELLLLHTHFYKCFGALHKEKKERERKHLQATKSHQANDKFLNSYREEEAIAGGWICP